MNLGELIAEARERVGDVSEPYLCSDARFTRFANAAQKEAARRARLLVDSSTEEVCTINLTAGEALYDLDPRVIFVRRATIDGQSRPLVRIHRKDLDQLGSEWMDEEGDVDGWVVGLDGRNQLRLYRKPTEAGVLRLTVVRLPLADMSDDSDEPELQEHHHLSLVDWMEHLYYSTRDSEMNDPKAADAAAISFATEFGAPMPAIEEQWAQEHYGQQEDDGNVYG